MSVTQKVISPQPNPQVVDETPETGTTAEACTRAIVCLPRLKECHWGKLGEGMLNITKEQLRKVALILGWTTGRYFPDSTLSVQCCLEATVSPSIYIKVVLTYTVLNMVKSSFMFVRLMSL